MRNNPAPDEIIRLRECIQAFYGIGITAAQDQCAEMLHTSRRSWQQWERGERKMHPAFWELILIKSACLLGKSAVHGARHGNTDRKEELC